MINLEVLLVESKTHPKLKLKLPHLATETILATNSQIPKSSISINISEFKKTKTHLEKIIELDEMELDMNSSAIEFVNYLPIQKALIVKFWNSACYVYYNIPEALYAFITIAESKGKVYHQLIQNKFRSKIIPEDFTVQDVKDVVDQELENDDINYQFNINLISLDTSTLSKVFTQSQSLKEKIAILTIPHFDYKTHLSEISDSFWLATTALNQLSLKTEEKNQILKNKKNHQYYCSPIETTTKNNLTLIIVPQYQMFCTHKSGLTTIPEFEYEIVEDENKYKLKKGTALMKIDTEGNLSLVKYRLNH